MSAEPLTDRLRNVSTAGLADVMQAMGYRHQTLSSDLRPVGATRHFAGPALCLKGRSGPPPPVRPGASAAFFEMDRRVRPGQVAIIETGGHRAGAVIGGMVGTSFARRGCHGIVTDGGIRDVDEFVEMGLPVHASYVSPISCKGLWQFTEVNVPVTLPGFDGQPVDINPEDRVVADTDGVVVVPSSIVTDVCAAAELYERVESDIRAELEKGLDREEAYSRHDRFAHVALVEGDS